MNSQNLLDIKACVLLGYAFNLYALFQAKSKPGKLNCEFLTWLKKPDSGSLLSIEGRVWELNSTQVDACGIF